jgi:hypothetical protein
LTSTLFKPPPADGHLGERQSFVLDLVRARPEGVTEIEAGARWHEQRGFHAGDRPCAYCGTTGRSILVSLRYRRGLVTRRRSGVWTLAGREPFAVEGHDPATGEIPY